VSPAKRGKDIPCPIQGTTSYAIKNKFDVIPRIIRNT
jgi:hypothetical protein